MATAGNQKSAISLRGVSKKYQLYESLGHRVYEALHPFKKKYHREFWALRDINLDIPKGATVGILGVNGSGKSTLLQIICSILQPTSGTVEVHGKVAALIELGAGFNPDLTGRENAEINCAIQGLDAGTVRNRLPGIEAFADIGEFFDQPVKTYSSGMFMRVAFATAISIDPDILIIDEALAVGDARFQQKCFRKFQDFQKSGKTIILVTHDRNAVPRLCNSAVLLNRGELIGVGSPKEIVHRYTEFLLSGGKGFSSILSSGKDDQALETLDDVIGASDSEGLFPGKGDSEDCVFARPTYNRGEHRYGVGGARIIDYVMHESAKADPSEIIAGAALELSIRVRYDKAVSSPIIGFSVKSQQGILVYGVNSQWLNLELSPKMPGDIAVYRFSFRAALASAEWFIDLAVASDQTEVLDCREGIIHLRVVNDIRTTGLVGLDATLIEI